MADIVITQKSINEFNKAESQIAKSQEEMMEATRNKFRIYAAIGKREKATRDPAKCQAIAKVLVGDADIAKSKRSNVASAMQVTTDQMEVVLTSADSYRDKFAEEHGKSQPLENCIKKFVTQAKAGTLCEKSVDQALEKAREKTVKTPKDRTAAVIKLAEKLVDMFDEESVNNFVEDIKTAAAKLEVRRVEEPKAADPEPVVEPEASAPAPAANPLAALEGVDLEKLAALAALLKS